MRIKNLLGLAAIVGAAAYAHKQRGGDLSLEGIKGSLDNLLGNVRSRLGQRGGGQRGVGQRMDATGQQGQPDQSVDASNASDTFGTDDFGTVSSADTSSIGSNPSTRRY